MTQTLSRKFQRQPSQTTTPSQPTETLALVSGTVNEHLGTDDVSERQEHLHQFSVPEFLR